MKWSDSKVEVGGHNPQVSGGPVVASGRSELMCVYLGEGGSNLWYTYANSAFLWQANNPIKDPQFGENITSSGGRPGLCYVASEGYFLALVPGKRVFDTWRYASAPWVHFDHHEDITELQFSNPALGDGGDRTHLLICDNLGNLWWYNMANHLIGNNSTGWTGQQRVASGKSPSITSIGDTLHALYWDTDQQAFVKLTLPHGAASWQQNRVFPQGQMPNQGAAIAALNGVLYVVFTQHGNDINWAPLNADFSLGTSQPANVATDAPPGLTTFHNSLVMLHKGKSSQNLWFAVGH